MIRESFIILDKVNQNKEKKLWEICTNWNQFLSSTEKLTSHFDYHKRQIKKAKEQLYNFNHTYFSQILPKSEHWRLYNFFKEEAIYLDIETTGFRGNTTIVGLYDGTDTKIFVKNKNLNKQVLQEVINKYKIIITFNGNCFDIPVLQREYDLDFSNHLHVDLRFVCAKIGLKGGLKNIEKEIGITRVEEVQDISGYEAVILWKKYISTGNDDYLNLLIKYNEEDIINLKDLAEYSIPKLWNYLKK